MSKQKHLVVAIGRGYANGAIRNIGDKFMMPIGAKGSWFVKAGDNQGVVGLTGQQDNLEASQQGPVVSGVSVS